MLGCCGCTSWPGLLADDSRAGSSHPVDLVQISLQTENSFAKQSRTLEDKVGGMSLNRFGGFLKRSWRMNDWTWGRMDAATMLCQIILSPERLRRRAIERSQGDQAETADRFVETLVHELFSEPVPAELVALWAEAVRELQPVYELERQDLPSSLPKLAALAAWAVHLRVAIEELPSIAASVSADRNERGNQFSKGELFLVQNAALLRELTNPPEQEDSGRLGSEQMVLGTKALKAFDRAGIGREPLDEEARSDQMIRTAATAASVAVTLADSNRSGLGAIKPVTRTLRGAMMVPYWTVLGLAAGGTIARFLALLTLASGALLLALSMLGQIDGWAAGPAAAIGIGAVLTAFGFAALRTGTLLHSVVLLTPVIPLTVYAVDAWLKSEPGSDEGRVLGVVALIVGLALALMLLGSMPSQALSPVATLYRALDRAAARFLSGPTAETMSTGDLVRRRLAAGVLWVVLFLLRLAAIGVVAGLLAWLGQWIIGEAAEWRTSVPVRVIVIAALLVVGGWLVGFWAGWRLRFWTEVTGSPTTYRTRDVSQSGGVAATWSVIYGTIFAFLAAGIIWRWPDDAGVLWKSALVTAVVFAILLLYAVPVAVLFGSIRVVSGRLVKDILSGSVAWPGEPQDQVKLLWNKDIRFRCLLKRTSSEATELKLTWWGGRRRLGRRLTRASTNISGQ